MTLLLVIYYSSYLIVGYIGKLQNAGTQYKTTLTVLGYVALSQLRFVRLGYVMPSYAAPPADLLYHSVITYKVAIV